MHNTICKAFTICLVAIPGITSLGQESPAAAKIESASADDSVQIKAAIQSYVAAFNAKDAEKLVEHWSPSGVYVSRTSDEQVIGRDVMKKEFGTLFKGDSAPKLTVVTESIEFISPNVALERGTAKVIHAADNIEDTSYSVVYVKRDGAWLIDRVTEDEIIVEVSHADKLQELEWMIGDWVDAGEGITIEMSCQWARNRNYISRKYKVSDQEQLNSSGLQIIGWDAAKKQFRSWLFDSEGGFVSGIWTRRDDKWIVQSVATLADGSQGSYTSIFQPTGDGNYTWRKINRVLDGKLLPNIDVVIVQRK